MDKMGRFLRRDPLLLQGQALTFPRRGLSGVGIEERRACICDFAPILAFLRRGGRDFKAGIVPSHADSCVAKMMQQTMIVERNIVSRVVSFYAPLRLPGRVVD